MFSVCGKTTRVIRFIRQCISLPKVNRLWRWHCDKWLDVFSRAIEGQVSREYLHDVAIIDKQDYNYLILYLQRDHPPCDIYLWGTGFYYMHGRPFSSETGGLVSHLRGREYWSAIQTIVEWYCAEEWRGLVVTIGAKKLITEHTEKTEKTEGV